MAAQKKPMLKGPQQQSRNNRAQVHHSSEIKQNEPLYLVKICYCTGSVLTTLLLRIVHPTLMEIQLHNEHKFILYYSLFAIPDQQFNIVCWVDGCMEPTDHQNLLCSTCSMSCHYNMVGACMIMYLMSLCELLFLLSKQQVLNIITRCSTLTNLRS